MSKIDHSLFSADEHALGAAYGSCPECSSALAIKHGKSGAFLGCSAYPNCTFSKPLHEYEESTLKLIDNSQCPLCQSVLAVKRGRYGLFIGCSQFPECHHIEKLGNATEAEQQVSCPVCKQGQLVKRSNKFGKVFYACDHYPRCKFALNSRPVAQPCPQCGFAIMQTRELKGEQVVFCANKGCNYSTSDVNI